MIQKWSTRVDVSLNPNTINQNKRWMLSVNSDDYRIFIILCFWKRTANPLRNLRGFAGWSRFRYPHWLESISELGDTRTETTSKTISLNVSNRIPSDMFAERIVYVERFMTNGIVSCNVSDDLWWHISKHYENAPIQIYRKFRLQNLKISDKNIFHISAQNMDCGYSLEPPRRF